MVSTRSVASDLFYYSTFANWRQPEAICKRSTSFELCRSKANRLVWNIPRKIAVWCHFPARPTCGGTEMEKMPFCRVKMVFWSRIHCILHFFGWLLSMPQLLLLLWVYLSLINDRLQNPCYFYNWVQHYDQGRVNGSFYSIFREQRTKNKKTFRIKDNPWFDAWLPTVIWCSVEPCELYFRVFLWNRDIPRRTIGLMAVKRVWLWGGGDATDIWRGGMITDRQPHLFCSFVYLSICLSGFLSICLPLQLLPVARPPIPWHIYRGAQWCVCHRGDAAPVFFLREEHVSSTVGPEQKEQYLRKACPKTSNIYSHNRC